MSMVEELKRLVAEVVADKSTSEWDDALHETSLQCFDFLRDHGQALIEALESKARYEFIRENFTLVIKGTGVYVELFVPYGKDGWTLDHYIDLARTKAGAGGGE